MKIIIVGAGISGLSTYLCLRKHLSPILQSTSSPLSIKIYESHFPRTVGTPLDPTANIDDLSASTALVGGGLGIGPNGMRVLKHISPALYDAVKAQGFAAKRFVFKSAYGWKLLEAGSEDRHGEREKERGEEEYCLGSSRHGVWQCLKDEVGDDVIQYRKIVEAVPAQGSSRARVRFDGGDEDDADLVIGADGVKSVVRGAIARALGDGEGKGAKRWEPTYEGLIGVGGFLDESPDRETLEKQSMTFVFGPNGFFGYSATAPNRTMWWSTREAPTADRKRISTEELMDEVRNTHVGWTDPVVMDLLKRVSCDSLYPTWTIGKVPTWGENGLVLVGDAAHALQPTSGQGSSQALEDAKSLALLLKHHISEAVEAGMADNLDDAIHRSTKALYEVREPIVRSIADYANKTSKKKLNMSKLEEYSMYFFFWLIGRSPWLARLMLGRHIERLQRWSAEEEIEKYLKKEKEKEAGL